MKLNLDIRATRLHVFVDASQDAYGAVVYEVNTYQNCEVSSQLVAAESRVAPLKSVSIPRLELMAAVLGVRLLLAVSHALETAVLSAVLWSDSMNVICWIKNHSRNFKTFVANRIGFIQEHSEPCQWRHVPSELNAADILSRGTIATDLSSSTWMFGPAFLQLDESEWPKIEIQTSQSYDSETKKMVTRPKLVTMMSALDSDWRLEPTRFSNWTRLKHTTAWVYRFLINVSVKSNDKQSGCFTTEEISDAEKHIIRKAQTDAFANEYLALSKGKPLSQSSKLIELDPVLDDDGLIRSGGRLENADFLPFQTKFPIILPRKHWVTKLIVKQYHEDGNHVLGTNQLLAVLSSRYWIVAGREEIREWERACACCRRRKVKPVAQIMAPLPKIRLRYSLRAFDQTGVDFAGLFLTIQGRGKQRQKRYLCLFTCLATRAVHLEMAYGLDSDFLNAFYRMASRRGLPKEIISDNGTNFVGAVKELKQLVAQLDADSVKSSLANRGVTWKFNPPYAPNFGGVFESIIKAAKRAIYAILGSGDITDEELMTAFSGAEGLINSRPLTYQSAHPHDDVPLTPNHFLHGQVGGIFAPDSVDVMPFNPRKRWRRIQELIRHLWIRWMKEWLPSLQTRKKWFTPCRDLQVDDVVLVISPEAPRSSWTLGVITKTYPGADGHVRVVDIKTNKTVITRPVTKVCPVEWTQEDRS